MLIQPQFTRKLDAVRLRHRKQRTQSLEVCCRGLAEHVLRGNVRPEGRAVDAVKPEGKQRVGRHGRRMEK